MSHEDEIKALLSTCQRALSDNDDAETVACSAGNGVLMNSMLAGIRKESMHEGYLHTLTCQ